MIEFFCLCLAIYALYRIYDAGVKLRVAQEEIRKLVDMLAKTHQETVEVKAKKIRKGKNND